MEDQERKWIKENLPDLIKNTNCNVLLLSYLQSKDIINSSDVEDINASAGDLAKAEKLYRILPQKAGSFDILLEALEHVSQTGTLAILQKLAGPKWVLDPQRMFLSSGENVVSFLENKKQNTLVLSSISTKITTDKILQNVPKSLLLSSSEILKNGFELKPWIRVVLVLLEEKWGQVFKKLGNYKNLKLIFVSCTNNKLLETIQMKYKGKIPNQKDITCWADLNPSFQLEMANKINQKCFGLDVSNMLEELEEKRLLELINDSECDFFTSGIQNVSSYYVDRTVVYKNAISLSIFEKQMPDIWIFKNMKSVELSSLANKVDVDVTSKQIRKSLLTCRFLILDFHTDFESICSKTKFAVHLIEKVGNNLYWKKTHGNMRTLLNCIEESIVRELSEAAMIETMEENPSAKGNTIIISDTPGMGKSFLLENLGRRLIKTNQERMVIYVVWSEFVDKFSVGPVIQIEDILQALAKIACKNKLSESIFQQIAPRIRIDLLLDGFDEIKADRFQIALSILSQLTTSMPKMRKWITTRPHYKKQLEEHCSTIAYHIAPFNEQKQTQFLNSFWMHSFATSEASQPNVSGNQIQPLNSNLLNKFTKHILRDIKNCLNQCDTDIVGIPLQCMLIAEALQEDAFRCSKLNNCNNVDALGFSFPISSISQLYRLFVATKIKYYLMRTQNSKIDLQTLEIVHFYYSLLLLFPQQATKFNLKAKLDSINSVDYLSVGILQAASLSDSPRFIHRTFAEYFISEFCIQQMQEPTISDYFLSFLFETVLNTEFTVVFIHPVELLNTSCFREKTVCHFLNSSIEIVIESNSLCNLIETFDNVYRVPMRVHQIAQASAVDNFENIFNFLAVTNAFHCHQNHLVFDKYFIHIIVFKSALGFIKACFKLYDALQQNICYQLDDANTYVVSEDLKQTVVKNWNIYFKTSGTKISLLHTAVIRGVSTVALFLVQNAGFINILKDCPLDFQNLIHFSVFNTLMESNDRIEERIIIIKKLIELNQEFLSFKVNGLPAIFCYQGHVRILEQLLLSGADPLSKKEDQNTLWHLVANKPSCKDFYRLLTCLTCCSIRFKIVNAKNNEGNTVLQVLVRSCNPEEKTFELLKKCGADFNTRNLSGYSPIFTAAAAFRNQKTINLLFKYGANIESVKNDPSYVGPYFPNNILDSSDEEDLLTTYTDLSETETFEGWEFFRVKSKHILGRNFSYKEVLKIILLESKEQNYRSFVLKCTEKYVTIHIEKNKRIKVERKTEIQNLTTLLELIIVLSHLLKFSLGFLKVLLIDTSSGAVGDLMVSWILDQDLNDELIISHLEWCILKGTDINTWSLNGSPLLNEILKISKSVKPLKFLLKKGAKVDRCDSNHNTALHVLFLCQSCLHYEATSLLIEKGASVCNRNADGNTPLVLLLKNKRDIDIDAYILLQMAGAICDPETATFTLHCLATWLSRNNALINTFKYLITLGANLWEGTNKGISTIDIIFKKYGRVLAESLLQLQNDKESKKIITQIDYSKALDVFKVEFERFSSKFELSNPKIFGMNIVANVEYSAPHLELNHLNDVLNEVYSDDMQDIAIIFAFVISSDFRSGLMLVCDWCKKRDAFFSISELRFRFKTTEGSPFSIFSFAVKVGSFECLEHLVENEGFRQQLFENSNECLLHFCLHLDNSDKIIKYLSGINPNLLNGKRGGKTLFEAEDLFPSDFVALLNAGASIDDFVISNSNISNCTNNGVSIMHHLPRFVDSNKYHKYILELYSKNLLPTLFLQKETVDGSTPLHAAFYCFEVHHETLKLLVDSGVDIDVETRDGSTPLMIAVIKEYSLRCVQMLINMGAKMSKKIVIEHEGRIGYEGTVLHYMIRNYFQDSEALNVFLKTCFEKNFMWHFTVYDTDGNTALYYMFECQHQNITADMLPLIFSDSSFIGLTGKLNQTILHYATIYLDLSAYETLIFFLKSLNMLSAYNNCDDIGNTPLHRLAAISAKSECISKHLAGEQAIDFTITNGQGETFLHCLVTDNVNKATLKSLFSSGVNPFVENTDGKTFVHCFIENNTPKDIYTLFVYLMENGLTELLLKNTTRVLAPLEYGILKNKISPDALKFLKRSGMSLNQVNARTNSTLLDIAALKSKDCQVMKCLINLGLNPAQQGKGGNTFLHTYIYSDEVTAIGFQDLTQFLIKQNMTAVFSITNTFGQTPLHMAAEKGILTPPVLNQLQPYFADINVQTAYGRSLLHCVFACASGFDILLVQTLLELGVDPTLVEDEGNTFLHYAAKRISNTDFFALTKYLSSKCDAATLFGTQNKVHGFTPLQIAVVCFKMSLETFELLKSLQVNFNVVDNYGYSILMVALIKAYPISTLTYLLKNQYCHVYVKNIYGATIAHLMSKYLSEYEYHEVVSCLLSCGHGDLFGISDNFNLTPLHYAVKKMEILPTTLDLLCGRTQATTASNVNINQNTFPNKSFVDLNAVDSLGDSILNYAVCGGRSLKFMQRLVELGANWKTKSNHNSNLAHMAASFGHLELLEYFVGLGCEINELDKDGDNALQCVVLDSSKNVYEIVEFLLRNGVEKANVNKKRKTAYDYAIEKDITDGRILNLLR